MPAILCNGNKRAVQTVNIGYGNYLNFVGVFWGLKRVVNNAWFLLAALAILTALGIKVEEHVENF
jgi:hypothetical protein